MKMQSSTNPIPEQPLPTSITSIINLSENKVEGPNGEEKRNGGDSKIDSGLPQSVSKKENKK